MSSESQKKYWTANIVTVSVLLAVWFIAGYVISIFLIEPINEIKFGQVGLGFWFAQQGSIFVFIVLVTVYAFWMDKLDTKFSVGETEGYGEEGES